MPERTSHARTHLRQRSRDREARGQAILTITRQGTGNSYDYCVEAFEQALRVAGKAPEIFNTDQGSQFTSEAWIAVLESAGVRVSMDGKGRRMDNVFIERLWRSVRHEGVYLWAPESVHELERLLARWFEDYNRLKPH